MNLENLNTKVNELAALQTDLNSGIPGQRQELEAEKDTIMASDDSIADRMDALKDINAQLESLDLIEDNTAISIESKIDEIKELITGSGIHSRWSKLKQRVLAKRRSLIEEAVNPASESLPLEQSSISVRIAIKQLARYWKPYYQIRGFFMIDASRFKPGSYQGFINQISAALSMLETMEAAEDDDALIEVIEQIAAPDTEE